MDEVTDEGRPVLNRSPRDIDEDVPRPSVCIDEPLVEDDRGCKRHRPLVVDRVDLFPWFRDENIAVVSILLGCKLAGRRIESEHGGVGHAVRDASIEQHGPIPTLRRFVLVDRSTKEQIHEQRWIAIRCSGAVERPLLRKDLSGRFIDGANLGANVAKDRGLPCPGGAREDIEVYRVQRTSSVAQSCLTLISPRPTGEWKPRDGPPCRTPLFEERRFVGSARKRQVGGQTPVHVLPRCAIWHVGDREMWLHRVEGTSVWRDVITFRERVRQLDERLLRDRTQPDHRGAGVPRSFEDVHSRELERKPTNTCEEVPEFVHHEAINVLRLDERKEKGHVRRNPKGAHPLVAERCRDRFGNRDGHHDRAFDRAHRPLLRPVTTMDFGAVHRGGSRMLTEPKIEDRGEQAYVGVRASVPMQGIADFIDESYPELFAHLEAHGVQPAGAPFLRYNLIDMERQLEIETGVPVAAPVPGEGRVFTGALPAGRYATLTHIGPYDGLIDANEALQQWARDQGLEWAMSETDEGDRFESRFEVYVTDPGDEPNPEKWETEVVYLLANA
jgi:effector-binding domain-containing protein